MVHVIGPRDRRRLKEFQNSNIPVINTTSSAGDQWTRGLSPFYLGPVSLYGNYIAKKMENAWQYAKVYPEHADAKGDPIPRYFAWAQAGWNNDRAMRYPMGRGAKPLYSYWDGKKLQYLEARKAVYVPLYMRCVLQATAWDRLKAVRDANQDIALWDFDGYDYISLGKSLIEVLNDPLKTMGHAFVLAMLLTMSKEQILGSIRL